MCVSLGPGPDSDAHAPTRCSRYLSASLWWSGTVLWNLQKRLGQRVRDPHDEFCRRQPCSRCSNIYLHCGLCHAWRRMAWSGVIPTRAGGAWAPSSVFGVDKTWMEVHDLSSPSWLCFRVGNGTIMWPPTVDVA